VFASQVVFKSARTFVIAGGNLKYCFGEFELDAENFQLSSKQQLVEITPKTFDLLQILVSSEGKVISKEELMDRIWPTQTASEASLSNLVQAARKALNDSGKSQSYIKTVRGRGFRFVCNTTLIHGNSHQNTSSTYGVSSAINDAPSIVVLPFENLSDDASNRYFVDGITEDIAIGLGRYREITVIAHDSSVLVCEQTQDAAEAARLLNVGFALSGSVRIWGNQVKISVRLVAAESRHQVWSGQFDRVLEDILDLQEEVSQKIQAMLVGTLEHTASRRSAQKDKAKLSAYECVQRGRSYFGDWSTCKEDVFQARQYFERAIQLDPEYAAAHSRMSAIYLWDFRFGWSNTPELSAVKCFEFAEKAIRLDPLDSLAYLALSGAFFHIKSDFEMAKSKLETAIDLNPNDYTTYCYACQLSTCIGDLQESRIYAHEARRRNPLLPDTCLLILGVSEYLSGRYKNALTTLLKLSTSNEAVIACLAACYAQLNRPEEAARSANEFCTTTETKGLTKNQWVGFWQEYFNFKDHESVERLVEGLKRANLVSA
jgi:TolB-like protein